MRVRVPLKCGYSSGAVDERGNHVRRGRFLSPKSILLMALAMGILLATACGGQTSQAAVGAGDNADAIFTLTTDMDGGRLVFTGVGGDIDGIVNPTLRVSQGERVKIVLVNGGGMHDIALPELRVQSAQVSSRGEEATVTFTEEQEGEFAYYCTIPGHRQAGMLGKLVAGG